MADHRTLPTRASFRFWWPITVRWGDMDAMGHVNNIMLFQYMESARVGFFEAMEWKGWKETNARQGPVVVSQTLNYRKQVFYPAELEVGLRCVEIRGRSFVLQCGIFWKDSTDLAGDGTTVLVWLDYGSGKAMDLPLDIRRALTED